MIVEAAITAPTSRWPSWTWTNARSQMRQSERVAAWSRSTRREDELVPRLDEGEHTGGDETGREQRER